ncbi:hypothetical protein [Aureimonas sp. AU12]|uniref:hypothetical protein n=1 Tax=Aureimonas sp. AU12 TaxID=1638161 RepID=UPI0007813316|nr:hypothetical protein [Aureimonas sp. AU12]
MHTQGSAGETLNLIWGAKAISKFIGRTERATFGMLESGELPAKKVSGKWVAERSKLTNFFVEFAS